MFKDFITSNALTRLLANVFIFVVVMYAVFIGGQELLSGTPIQPLVYVIVSSALTYATTVIGIHLPSPSVPNPPTEAGKENT